METKVGENENFTFYKNTATELVDHYCTREAGTALPLVGYESVVAECKRTLARSYLLIRQGIPVQEFKTVEAIGAKIDMLRVARLYDEKGE